MGTLAAAAGYKSGKDADVAVADAMAVLGQVSEEWQVKRKEREARQRARREARDAASAANRSRPPLRDVANTAPSAMTMARRAATTAGDRGGGGEGYRSMLSRLKEASSAKENDDGDIVIVDDAASEGDKVRVERVWTTSGDGSEVTMHTREVQVTGKRL